mgnify:CR=1 FL=1
MTHLLGLVGRDISYSLSPRIHESAARHLGITATYQLHDLATPGAVRDFLDHAWQNGVTGLNITQPWKKLLSDQPVNTLFRQQGKSWWSMTSTDAAGFFAGLARIGCHQESIQRVIFLGNGGVVDAIRAKLDCPVDCLARSGAPGSKDVHQWSPLEFARLIESSGQGTLVIQATPAPLRGDTMTEFARALTASGKSSGLWFVDLCYGKTSSILEAARSMGIPSQDGIPMLIEQAREAQQIWWGHSAPYELIERACRG